jgi:hypothetical protein
MRRNITEPRQTSIPLNVEPKAKPVVVVVSRGGEARRQKRQLGGRKAGQDFLGVVQKKNEEEMPVIQKREGSGSSKSQTRIERKVVAVETMEKTPEGLHRARETGQNSICMQLMIV